MTRTKIFFLLLSLPLLACTLTAQVTPSPTKEQKAIVIAPRQALQPATALTLAPVCKVKTGFAEGRLNLRACSGLACPVLAVIVEGEILTPTQTEPISGWLEVKAGSLRGWVNSKLTNCEVKK